MTLILQKIALVSSLTVLGAIPRECAMGPDTGGATGSGGAGGSGGARTPEQIIAAAQTPDGSAIPQASVNGHCPEVVALLGFWSCVTIGDQCTYMTSGATHECACQRVDGEGQLPAWICN
jgi:hypothetical protein